MPFRRFAVVILLAVRLMWNLVNPPPPAAPTKLGVWLDRLGHATHFLLYALLIAAPIAGIVLQFARGGALPSARKNRHRRYARAFRFSETIWQAASATRRRTSSARCHPPWPSPARR